MAGSTLLLTALLVAALAFVHSNPINNNDEALAYLTRFGYMSGPSTDEAKRQRAILNFQYMANLTQTGEMNSETYRKMNLPRCGMPDNVGHNMDARRRKRYSLGSRWSRTDLTYRIDGFTPDINQAAQESTFAEAFKVWADVSPLTFRRVYGNTPADIVIFFAGPGDHGDGVNNVFDGPFGVLAHAFFPETGDAHFDEGENWSVRSSQGINLFQVAAHEFGHSLGLGHSNVEGALMEAFYAGYVPNFQLHSDDIDGIQAHYGAGSGGPDVTMAPNPPPGPDMPDCTGVVNAVTTTRDGSTYIFEGQNVWKFEMNQNQITAGFPQPIATTFVGLPNDIDAALHYPPNGKTYIFKGSQYWQVDNEVVDANYPRDIGTDWAGLPDNLDAAFIWSGNRNIYFVKGDQYYRFNGRVDRGYPRPLSVWNIPGNQVGAALQWTNRRTYFFTPSGGYYRFDDASFGPEEGYPRDVATLWQGCTSALEAVPTTPASDDNGVNGLVPSLFTLVVTVVFGAVHQP